MRDHPRSRGVYAILSPGKRRAGGSSPLARGLRGGMQVDGVEIRIIPARAGFTVYGGYSWCDSRDHPRSRGVYIFCHQASTAVSGSSPLARGLRPEHSAMRCNLRIIPARAGFTPRSPIPYSRRKDHPRSRGVYFQATGSIASLSGSSPLARGLLRRYLAHDRWRRIIPARAGFTTYRSTIIMATGGSSPLARGLRRRHRPDLRNQRIIPARAGFTGRTSVSWSSGRDHPRSRGVYSRNHAQKTSRTGSSPLARGLHGHRLLVGGSPRIIPARAGFTR